VTTFTPTNRGPSSLGDVFQLRKINQMEREIWQYLEWELNADPSFVTLREFADMSRFLPYIHPTINEEVDAATHCQPLCSIEYESVAVVQAAVSPLHGIYDTLPPDRVVIAVVIARSCDSRGHSYRSIKSKMFSFVLSVW
jgi:hypothetical protein